MGLSTKESPWRSKSKRFMGQSFMGLCSFRQRQETARIQRAMPQQQAPQQQQQEEEHQGEEEQDRSRGLLQLLQLKLDA
jgi:hypothetical protein